MKQRVDVADYYRRLRAIGIADVAERVLAGRITERNARGMRVDCPHHDSNSKTALSISFDQGLWWCFGCGVGGDALQLIEFVHHGVVTKHNAGKASDTHRSARDYLASLASLPRLAEMGMSRDELEKLESDRADSEAVFASMTELARHYHAALMGDGPEPERIREWLRTNYSIEPESIQRLMIGWADDPNAFGTVVERCASARSLAATGAFGFDSEDRPFPFFRRRVVFPYWSSGRVVYMIARRVPWDPEDDFEPKYKKLPTWSDNARPWISKAVDGSILWGEDVLATRPKRVVVVEGVPDAIAAQQAGFSTVAITSARPAKEEIEKIVRKLRGVGTVYFAQDNELSGIGQDAAMKSARMLEAEKIRCLVAVVPMRASHSDARARLNAILGDATMAAITDAPPAKRKEILRQAVLPDVQVEVERLIGQAKVDVADFFARGGSPAEFEAALTAAREPIEISIDAIRKVDDASEMARRISPLLVEIAQMRPAAREKYIKRLREKTGLSLAILKQEVADTAKNAVTTAAPAVPQVPQSEPGSCRELIEIERIEASTEQRPVNWSSLAEKVFDWMIEHGGRFFRDRAGAPALFWDNEVWPMVGGGSGDRARYEGLMYRLTNLVPTTAGARTFYSTMCALAADRGTIKDQFPWIHTDISQNVVWVNLNNPAREIARITSSGVTIVKNGDNEDGVILRGDAKFGAIEYDATADHTNLESELDDLIGSHMACRPESKRALMAWIMCLPLIEFAGTRPMIRLEGQAASGKTFAAKMVTTLVYGDEAQKKSTDAANYADAARNPLVALDNVEVQNATPSLIDFLLTSVTGITREKRAHGTDSGVISERPTCLVLSTGIEPLAGELEEVMTRSLVLRFNKEFKDRILLEKQVLARIKRHRSKIMSAIFRRASDVLALIEAGSQEQSMQLIRDSEGHQGRTRCDEYLSLMYLQTVAASSVNRDALLQKLSPAFDTIVKGLDETAASTTRESSAIATPLISLFIALREGGMSGPKYGLEVDDARTFIRDATPTLLFIALRQVAKERNVPFAFKNASQFGARMTSGIGAMQEQGFDVQMRINPYGQTLYTLRWDIDRGAMTRLGYEAIMENFRASE